MAHSNPPHRPRFWPNLSPDEDDRQRDEEAEWEADLGLNEIPCCERDLKVHEYYIRTKVPQERRDEEPVLILNGKTIYDPWMREAERQLVRDLKKANPPIHLDHLDNLRQLTPLKALKVCELLFRTNVKEPMDQHAARADYFCSLFKNELASLPAMMLTGAQVTPSTGLIRC